MVEWVTGHAYGPGDAASIVGLLVALVGFGVTIWKVRRAQSSADQAAAAARTTADRLRFVETVVDLSALVSDLETLKLRHRLGDWRRCLDGYADLRRKLVQVRAAGHPLDESDTEAVQGLIQLLYSVEKRVKRALEKENTPLPSELNALLSIRIDAMVAILARLSRPREGEG